MANKRMFDKQIVESDAFLDMPVSSQALYFHLAMNADDDGFINAPKRIQRSVGACEDDMKVLVTKKFIIPFDSGVVVIKHWKMQNSIPKDRYKPTEYQGEFRSLFIKENKAYSLNNPSVDKMYTECIQTVNNPYTQIRSDQISIDQDRIDKDSIDQSSIIDKLNNKEWDKLEATFEDLISLIDMIDDRLGANVDSIRNPYNYILKVANDEGWVRKNG